MAKKQIKKITRKTWNDTETCLGIELPSGNFLTEHGEVAKHHLILEIKNTRVKPEVRECFLKAYDLQVAKEKAEEEIAKFSAKRAACQADLLLFPSKLQTAMGLLTIEEFYHEFVAALPAGIRYRIEHHYEAEYNPVNPTYIGFSRTIDIEKYYRGCLVEMEYDGTFCMAYGYQKTEEYKWYMEKYSMPLPLKGKEYSYHEGLGLGDKNWLYYCGEGRVSLSKPLTKDYAISLAKKLS